MIRQDLQDLFIAQTDTAKALIAAYSRLIGGVPTQAGLVSLINNAVSTNYGAGEGITFNQENIFINIFNGLVRGNTEARTSFETLIGTVSTLSDQIGALYRILVPSDKQTAEGLAYLTRPEALAFFVAAANERGVEGTIGAAIVALSALTDIMVDADLA